MELRKCMEGQGLQVGCYFFLTTLKELKKIDYSMWLTVFFKDRDWVRACVTGDTGMGAFNVVIQPVVL